MEEPLHLSAHDVAHDAFNASFVAWLKHANQFGGLRRRSSIEVYRAIWSSFTDWCRTRTPPVALVDVSKDDLRSFLGSRRGTTDPTGELSDRHTWVVLNLVDRVLRHRASTLDVHRNSAAAHLMAERPAVRYANTIGSALPDHLLADEARALVVFLTSVGTLPLADGDTTCPWQELRNRAAVGLQFGAGLAPGDIRAMTLDGVVTAGGPRPGIAWKLRVPADGNTPARETPIAAWAGRLLGAWITVRATHRIPGNWLFPSTKTGKHWSKMAQYRAAQQVLADAGVDASDGGSFKLRHTFALRQLRRGRSAEDVARWMGIARLETLERYRRVLQAPVDVD